MTQSPTPPPKDTVSVAEVAKHLAKALGGTSAYWSTWLANDRKPGRVNRCLPQESGLGRPRYSVAVVDAYVADYKRDHPEAGHTPGSSKGRRFAPHISAMTLADGADQAAVLFVIPKPLASYVLSAHEARHTAARLIKAADEIEEEANHGDRQG
jgi:hypothetical protein